MKNLNWNRLTDDILEAMVINQSQLAEICKITQQSVSNWKTGSRSPGVYARNQLRQLAQENGLDIENYKNTKVMPEMADLLNLNEDVLNIALKLSALPSSQQSKVLEMTEFLINKA